MSTPLWPYLAVPGLAVGVISRGIVWRLAVDDPPRRGCSSCGTGARSALVPGRVFTGRCIRCGARTYPPALVPEVLVAGGFAFAGWIGGGGLRVAGLCWLFAFAIPAVLVDAAVQRLPDVLTWPCLAGVIVFCCGQAAVSGEAVLAWRTVLAGAAAGAAFLLLALIADVGIADAKLAASLGAVLGYLSWSALVAGLAAGMCLAGLYAAVLLALRRKRTHTRMPMGPPLLAGTILVLALTS